MLKTSRREEGNMIVAMMILTVIVSLSATVLSRTIVEQHAVRQNQDFNSALASADAGLSDGLFQLDQAANDTATFTNAHSTGAGSWSYTATYVDPQTYTIRARGTVNGRTHDVMATVTRALRFDYNMFSVQSISMSGNCLGSMSGPIGSGGSISLTGGGTCGYNEDCFLPGTGPCPSAANKGRQFNFTHPEKDPTPPPGNTQACPTTNPTFSGSVDGKNGTPFVCSSGTTTFGDLTVTNGPLIIYVTAGSANLACSTINGGSGGTSPAVNFQLYIVPSVTWTWNGCGPDISGGIYAPHASITANGGKVSIKGAIVANDITIHGAPNLSSSDTSLSQVVTSDWKVTNYHEVPTTCTSSC